MKKPHAPIHNLGTFAHAPKAQTKPAPKLSAKPAAAKKGKGY